MGGYFSGFGQALSENKDDDKPIRIGKKKDASDDYPDTPEFKKGGKVRKTGLAKVHEGERVLTKKQAKRYDKKKRA